MDWGHLRPEACAVAARSAPERLAHLRASRWLGYGRASQALAQSEEMLAYEPGQVRPRNLLIVGPTNNGKTMIAERFRRAHPARAPRGGRRETVPVLPVQMPPAPTVARFHAAVLAALGTAVGFRGEAARMEGLALGLLREAGCRMLLIDELHNLLAATAQRQRELLNLMRFLGNELGIPLVCLGTRDAYLAIRSDDQLENRFHPLPLPPWEDDAEFGRLLASFEAVLPLREPSQLGAPAMRELVMRRSEGTIGEVAALLAAAARTALLAGRERIDAGVIEAADYRPPSARRRLLERELR
jgi:hypothetical protein